MSKLDIGGAAVLLALFGCSEPVPIAGDFCNWSCTVQ